MKSVRLLSCMMSGGRMPNNPLPKKYRRFYHVDTVDEMWSIYLNEGNERSRIYRPINGRIPSNPRCLSCLRPFGGVGGALFRVLKGLQKSTKNPLYCTGCYGLFYEAPGGAEVELTMLFVDVRGSTTIAETMSAVEFSRLMNRFYEAAINVLIHKDAFVDKLVGDEVTALFIPGFTGEDHARKAVEAGKGLLQATGHGSKSGPWVPVGVGIHAGVAWVGSIKGANEEVADFTASVIMSISPPAWRQTQKRAKC